VRLRRKGVTTQSLGNTPAIFYALPGFATWRIPRHEHHRAHRNINVISVTTLNELRQLITPFDYFTSTDLIKRDAEIIYEYIEVQVMGM
jgi:hypothetical protein